MLSLYLRLYILACPSSQMASSYIKGSTWNLAIYRMMLERSLLQYRISFASTCSCFSFSFLHDFLHALSLTSLSLPAHLSCASWSGPVSCHSLYKQSDSLAGSSFQTSVEVQGLSHLSCLLFCHFLDLSAVTWDLFPVPVIHSCKLNSCLSNPVTAVNIYTVLAS